MLSIKSLILLICQSLVLYFSQEYKFLLFIFIINPFFYKKFYGIFVLISLSILLIKLFLTNQIDLNLINSLTIFELYLVSIYLFLALIADKNDIFYIVLLPIIFFIISSKLYEYTYVSEQNYFNSFEYWFAITVFIYGTYFLLIKFFKKIYFWIKLI